MGNVAVTILKRNIVGGRRVVTADFKLSTSYATNGDTLLAADRAALMPENGGDLTKVIAFDCETGSDGTSLSLDKANNKIKAFSGRAEVANATNLNVAPGNIRAELHYEQAN